RTISPRRESGRTSGWRRSPSRRSTTGRTSRRGRWRRSAPPGPPILGGERLASFKTALKDATSRLPPGLGGRGGRAPGGRTSARSCSGHGNEADGFGVGCDQPDVGFDQRQVGAGGRFADAGWGVDAEEGGGGFGGDAGVLGGAGDDAGQDPGLVAHEHVV